MYQHCPFQLYVVDPRANEASDNDPDGSLILVNSTKDPSGIPQLYASNFQVFSVAQKEFGYLNGSTSAKPIFHPNVTASLDFTDSRLGTLVNSMKTAGIYNSTLLIVCAEHGQAPIDPTTVKKIDPQTLQNATSIQFAQVTADDIALIWLVDSTIANVNQAKAAFLRRVQKLES